MRILHNDLESCDKLLHPYVKFYTYTKFEPPANPLWIPADRRNQLLFLKEGDVELHCNGQSYPQPSISLRPVFEKPLTVKFSTSTVEVVNIEFTAIGLYHLFDIDLVSYVNKLRDVQDLFPPSFIDQLNPKNYKETIDKFLLAILKKNRKKVVEFDIDKVIKAAESIDEQLRVKNISKLLDVNPKKLYRYFRKYTGLPPKQYFRILQFEATLLEILRNEQIVRKDLINRSGYFDQAHFIKAIQKFTGSSPTKIKYLDTKWLQFLIRNDMY